MDDIARGAGLSKGGLYAHFGSKEEIFQALLARSLPPVTVDEQALAASTSVRELVETLVDGFYGNLGNPVALATLRLLVSEAGRVPDVITRWRAQFPDEYLEVIRKALENRAAEGMVRATALTRNPWLALAPALYPVLQAMILGSSASESLSRAREAHVTMLCELLDPAPAREPAAPRRRGTR